MHLPLCIIAAEANKQHRKSTSKVKEKKGKQTRKFRVDVAAKATVVSWFSAVVFLFLSLFLFLFLFRFPFLSLSLALLLQLAPS